MSRDVLLETIETKRSLTSFLIKKSIEHLQKRNIRYVVAGNHPSFREPPARCACRQSGHIYALIFVAVVNNVKIPTLQCLRT